MIENGVVSLGLFTNLQALEHSVDLSEISFQVSMAKKPVNPHEITPKMNEPVNTNHFRCHDV